MMPHVCVCVRVCVCVCACVQQKEPESTGPLVMPVATPVEKKAPKKVVIQIIMNPNNNVSGA